MAVYFMEFQAMHYAHSTSDPSRTDWQVLESHLTHVAEQAAAFGAVFGASRAAGLAGLLHDLGKYNPEFQAYISGARRRVDHSTAGAATVLELSEGGKLDDRLIAELIAYAIAGHHTGLPDMQGESLSTLSERLKGFQPASLDAAWKSDITTDVSALMPSFQWTTVDRKARRDEQEAAKGRAAFQLAFLGRMIFSCLVDADFKDTELFYARTDGRQVDRDWPPLQAMLPDLAARFNDHMAGLESPDIPINSLRREILSHVRGRAFDRRGLFTLTVPTGGGKTLASLGFALDHARVHGHGRIIYAIPFTSIIDQTASIFRKVLGEEALLEHHSAIEEEHDPRQRAREGKDKLKLAMEDWAAAVVVTTNVQFFESLFAARTSRSRKVHNIANSVIILDEAQTLPRPLLAPAVSVLRELAANYGCTIVLCTATQPALEERRFPAGHPAGLPLEGRELAPNPDGLARQLTRVRLRHAGAMDDSALIAGLAEASQGLVIVNSRKHALALYRSAREAGLGGLVHLTTRQHAVDRRRILETVRQCLKDERPCRLIATSLVEAGVDLDFPRVWRAEAGLDQIAQAAGRCNREGGRPVDDSIVTVFNAPDNPPPPEIKGLSGDMRRMMDKHADLFSPAAIEDFFGEVYWRLGPDGLDAKDILSDFRIGSGSTDFAYRAVADKFRMIESGMVPVIIARDDEAREVIGELKVETIPSGIIARKLQPYTVQVPPPARQRLIDCGHAAFHEPEKRGEQFAVLVTESLYEPNVGLLWEDAEYLGSEQWMI